MATYYRRHRRAAVLLSDAKAAEDLSQKIIARELAGDFTQCKLSAPQLFSEKFEGMRGPQGLSGLHHASFSASQRVEMSAPG